MSSGSKWKKWDLHVHTASSYDYAYKAEDSDDILVKAWRKNKISAVAITDHFIIDSNRIEKLKAMAPEIAIFPGVELRCDKGTSNLHIVLIFPNIDIRNLENRFNVIMRDTKAKNKNDNGKIYWDFSDIVDFAKEHNGIISVHAGKKDKGIDDRISNSLEVNEAIKAEIANYTHIFEMGRLKDFDVYNKYVFSEIDRKPMIICSDNHDARKYILKHNLWIKADCTFEGLEQAIKEPILRFFVGDEPEKMKIVRENEEKFIDSITIKGKTENDKWFNQTVKLNSDLVTIIGNKGNGKSALADIIGHAGNTKNNRYSFLGSDRFNRKNEYLGKRYQVKIKWKNGVEEEKSLYPSDDNIIIEKVKYLPQRYIEDICNDLQEGFKEEIERLIFDYLPEEEKLSQNSFSDLINYITQPIENEIDKNQLDLINVNRHIIEKERSISAERKEELNSFIKESQQLLTQEMENKPQEIEKPNINEEDNKSLLEINLAIENINNEIEIKNNDLKKFTKESYVIKNVVEQIIKTQNSYEEWVKRINNSLKENGIECEIKAKLDIDYNELLEFEQNNNSKIRDIKYDVGNNNEDGQEGKLIIELRNKQNKLKELTSKMTQEEVNYQNSLQEINKWRERIKTKSSALEELKCKLKLLEEEVPKELEKLYETRKCICERIFNNKKKILNEYSKKYSYINNEIKRLSINETEKPSVETNLYLDISTMQSSLLNCVHQNVKSIFRGKEQAKENLIALLDGIDINSFNSIYNVITNLESEFKKSVSDYERVFSNKVGFFNALFSLEFINFNYELKLGDKVLKQLSPGERGLLLLIFYLLLDKDNSPLIVDQPEDNLDNQSVYNRLVPYIIEAKQKRQIIIVTHNPNIAVACDSEEIVYSNMDKENLEIKYTYGSIENPTIKTKIIDVLEGTMPAFSKRKNIYDKIKL